LCTGETIDKIIKYHRDCHGFKKAWIPESEYCIDCKKNSLEQYNLCKKAVEAILKDMYVSDADLAKVRKNKNNNISWGLID